MSNYFSKDKMRAALLYGPNDVRIEDVDIPKLEANEVLVRVKKIGICPSDVRIYQGIYKHEPVYGKESYGTSGHEWTGEIVKVGSAVKGFSLGDRVVPQLIIPCGVCKFCRKGITNLCISKTGQGRGYAEYTKAIANALFKLPENVSYEEAAFAEPIGVCLHANEIISPRPGDTVLIIGGGPMGLIHLQLSKLSGATTIVSEVVESRLEVAKHFGADAVINPAKEDMPKKVKEMTDGYGADGVIVAVGNKVAIESAFKAASAAGTIVLFGGTYPLGTTIQIDPNVIHYGELNVTGCYDHMATHIERTLKVLSKKAINVEGLISNTFPLERLKEGLELVKSASAIKVQVAP